jgi:hypothetical protein
MTREKLLAMLATVEVFEEMDASLRVPESHVYLVAEHGGTPGLEFVREMVSLGILQRHPGPTLARGPRFAAASKGLADAREQLANARKKVSQ